MRRIVHAFHILLLSLLLASCNLGILPTSTDMPSPPTAILAATISPIPPPTRTVAPTPSPPTTTSTPQPTSFVQPTSTLPLTPTPVSGWAAYENDYLGYGISHPSWAKIFEQGAGGMETNEVIPPGFNFDEYFNYVMAIMPDDLCVSIGIAGALVTIVPPYPVSSYVIPCPGMGIGDQYTIEQADETITIAGQHYIDSNGGKLYLKSTGAFYAEYYFFDLENGFRIVFNGGPRETMSMEDYLPQRAIALEMISSLYWFRIPDLTKPGTTCAGKFTQLLPGTYAVVVGNESEPPNRVRSGPTTSDRIITQIYPQTVVKVVEGPVCADGLVFWRVANSLIPGGFGWTAEGDGTDHWLERIKP